MAADHRRPLASRLFWLIVGLVALALGMLGVVLPLLPTTPFLLLAAFAFMRSSKTLYDWLVNHRVFGGLIDDWHRHNAISRSAKIVAIGAMLAIFVISLVMQAPGYLLALQAVVLGVCMWFVGSRPLPPEKPRGD